MTPDVALGTLLFTAVEPHRGHEVAYNRWYETDHFYAGCMTGPWCFAGRRFVAPKRLKQLRTPANSPLCEDPMAGSYLSLYWIEKGQHGPWTKWAVDTVHQLHANGRMFAERDHTHTAMYEHRSSMSQDTPIELALDRPFAGLVITAGELRNGQTLDDLDRWSDDWVAAAFDEPWGPTVVGTNSNLPLPADAPDVPENAANDRRFLQLHFLDHDPADGWDAGWARWGTDLEAAGVADHLWTSPYIPTVPGTDRYTNELW
jgi:hypothetical protein